MKLVTGFLLALLVSGAAHAQTPVDWKDIDKVPMEQQLKNGINHVLVLNHGTMLAGGNPTVPGLVECRRVPTWVTIHMLEAEIKRLELELALRKSGAARVNAN